MAQEDASPRELCERESKSLATERKRVMATRRALLPRAELIKEQTKALIAQREELTQQRNRLNQAKLVTLRGLRKKVNARRRKLVHQLTRIYPLGTAPLSTRCVCFLSVDFSAFTLAHIRRFETGLLKMTPSSGARALC